MTSARALAGYALACLAAVVGVGLQWGLAVALMAGGVIAAVSCLVLVDVDEKPGPADERPTR